MTDWYQWIKSAAALGWVRTLLAATALGSVVQSAEAGISSEQPAIERAQVIRERLLEQGGQREKQTSIPALIAQWFNWGNWGNWRNWPNWRNY